MADFYFLIRRTISSSEPEHTGVNVRVLKALGGVVFLASLEEPVAESPARSRLFGDLAVGGEVHTKAQPLPRQIGHDHIHTCLGIMMGVPRLKVPRPAILHERVIKEAPVRL